MTPAAIIASALAWIVGQPAIRAIIEDVFEEVCVRVIADFLSLSGRDPAFATKYNALVQKLAQTTDAEDKREILIEIRALRSGTQSLP